MDPILKARQIHAAEGKKIFSRSVLPYKARFNEAVAGKQVCVIPFKRTFLLEYTELIPTPLEIAESVDMMRVLEYGMNVRMIPTKYQTHAVDTVEDLKKVEKLLKIE